MKQKVINKETVQEYIANSDEWVEGVDFGLGGIHKKSSIKIHGVNWTHHLGEISKDDVGVRFVFRTESGEIKIADPKNLELADYLFLITAKNFLRKLYKDMNETIP
jgi:hypothetical protein